MKHTHIFNGDALKEHFPKEQIVGEVLVARECLVVGPTQATSLDHLFRLRAAFIKSAYGQDNYYEHTAQEIKKINNLSDGQVHLWFEEDLFCQVNLWFVCSLLYLKEASVTLVMPKDSLKDGFGGLSKEQLVSCFGNKKALTNINVNQFALLWFAYKNNDIERLLKLGVQMYANFPFVMKAIEAHLGRLPKDGLPSLPEQLIRKIIKEKSTLDFEPIFRSFNEIAPIYGYGDLQVKSIFDEILKNEEKTFFS